MLNNVIKSSFTIVGAITGVSLTRTFFIYEFSDMPYGVKLVVYVLAALILSIVFYSTANKVIEVTMNILDKLEATLQRLTLYELVISSVGLIIGLAIANLVTIPIIKIAIIGVPLSIVINITFGLIGVVVANGKKNESLFDSFKQHGTAAAVLKNTYLPKILDTSVIIDGRIVDICRTGFVEGELVVPSFVLEELRHIADSTDALKRNRGRRGLDILNILQKDLECPVRIENAEIPADAEVDSELLNLAHKLGGSVLTIDFNLNKVASFQGVPVLNINELANAVKPVALPGEEMLVQVIKDGKENGQGIGYLEDGTMIVIEGGRRYIGENLSVIVTSVLQTAAGRMIFAKPKYNVERVI